MLKNRIPEIVASIEYEENRAYVMPDIYLKRMEISPRRWGKIRKGTSDLTLDEANKLAEVFKLQPLEIITYEL